MQAIRVQTIAQGVAVLEPAAYDIKAGPNVVSFYVDAWGLTGRAYPVATSNSTSIDDALVAIPSIVLESGAENNDAEELTEICFPDFTGWDVHCCSGGKIIAVCLTKS